MHQYDAERVEWLRRLTERLEELARRAAHRLLELAAVGAG